MTIAYITCKDRNEAKKISSQLLKKKLIACANIFPVESMYRWEGKIVNENESAIFAKISANRFDEVVKETEKLHSYKVPCIMKIDGKINPKYGKWLKGILK